MREIGFSIAEAVLNQGMTSLELPNGLIFHPKKFCLTNKDGEETGLSASENLVLLRAATNPGKPLPHAELLRGIEISRVNPFLSGLRKKVDPEAVRGKSQILYTDHKNEVTQLNPKI